MPTIRYYLIDTTKITAEDYDRLLKQFNTLHKQSWPKNELSVAYNNDTSQALIKVVNDTLVQLGTEKIRVYTKTDHKDAITLIYSDTKWNRDNITDEQIITLKNKYIAQELLLQNAKI